MEGGKGGDLFSTKAKKKLKKSNLCASYSCGGSFRQDQVIYIYIYIYIIIHKICNLQYDLTYVIVYI